MIFSRRPSIGEHGVRYVRAMHDNGLFAGIRIVELGQYVAAPYAAELFAHGGADVVSIEPVGGGPTRHNQPVGSGDGRQYVIKARGKRAAAVSLSTEEGAEIVRSLVREADILIANLRPGLAERIGLGFEQLHAEQPELIYGTISGWGELGPLADRACVDLIAQADAGLLRSVGVRSEGHSAPSDVLICDYVSGSLLAFGLAAALRSRERNGRGQLVSTSLIGAALVAQHRTANRFEHLDQWQDELVARASDETEDFEELSTWRAERLGIWPFFYNIYACRDGELAVGAVGAQGRVFLDAIGLNDVELEVNARAKDLTVLETADLVRAHLSDRSIEETLAAVLAVGLPAARVRFLEEALADPDLLASGLTERFEHPVHGTTTMPAPPVRFSESVYRSHPTTPAPAEHTDEVLRQLGYDPEVIERLVADGVVGRAGS